EFADLVGEVARALHAALLLVLAAGLRAVADDQVGGLGEGLSADLLAAHRPSFVSSSWMRYASASRRATSVSYSRSQRRGARSTPRSWRWWRMTSSRTPGRPICTACTNSCTAKAYAVLSSRME